MVSVISANANRIFNLVIEMHIACSFTIWLTGARLYPNQSSTILDIPLCYEIFITWYHKMQV